MLLLLALLAMLLLAVVAVGEVQLSQPLADCTTEREGTSVPVVISRSSGSRVRRGKTDRGGGKVRDGVGRGGRLLERFEGLCQ